MSNSAIPYMLVGSFSSNVYGIPRSTKDADFVVQLEGMGIDAVVRVLGAGFELDPQASFETVTATTRYPHPSLRWGVPDRVVSVE